MDKFTILMKWIAEAEWGNRQDGAYTNDPVDPGGETKFGISKRGNPDLDIKNLTLEQATQRYRERYWEGSGANALPFELAACVFDTAVNMGFAKAKRFLKECDGNWGKYLEARSVSYLNIIAHNPSLKKYQNGWLNRINHLKTFVLAHRQDFLP